jgi:hypothetical protein
MNYNQVTDMVKKLWSKLKWFDMTISGDNADVELYNAKVKELDKQLENNKINKDEYNNLISKLDYINITDNMLFKSVEFKAIDKTENSSTYILNASSRTKIVLTDDMEFNPDIISASGKYFDISQLDTYFNTKANYGETTKDGVISQFGNQNVCTIGTISSDPIETPYGVMFYLDDLKLGFDIDKKITLFMNKDAKGMFGKNTRMYVFGRLRRSFDNVKGKFLYPSINVSSYYITKLVKPVDTDESINNLKMEIKTDTTEVTLPVESKNEQKKEINEFDGDGGNIEF